MRKKIITLILIFIILLFQLAKTVSAQGVDLGIYPPIFQIQTIPPADVSVPFFIQNFQDQSVELSITVRAFTSSDNENGEIVFLQDTNPFPDPFLNNRIKVLDNNNAVSSLIISPKQKRNLTLEVKIPNNEPKGDYYFSLVFSSNGKPLNTGNFSLASGAVASNILLSVGPLGKTQGLIENFSAPLFVTQGPVPFNVRIKNTSDHYIAPKGDISIKNMFGQTVGKVNLLPVNILSNTIRRIPDSLQSGTAKDSDYNKIKAVVEKNGFPVAVWPERFLFGPYTATITIALSDQGPLFVRKVSFFAFPAEYMLGILLIIGIVIFIILRIEKRKNTS
jgi:hypothetical protein